MTYLLVGLIAASAVFYFSSGFLSVDYNQERTISIQLFVIPKYDLTVNFTIEIPRVNISTSVVQSLYYNITKRPDPGVKQIACINFRLSCNKSKPIYLLINELEPIKGWSPEHLIYYDLAQNYTINRIVKTYFSTFITVYTVTVKWLGGASELPIFRDAYHYQEGARENNYTTERVSFIMKILSILLAFITLGIVLSLHPNWRITILRYYPWLTIIIVGASVLVFVLWTPAEFSLVFRSSSALLSYFPHFDSYHLIGNLKLGIITLLLLESWIGAELGKSLQIRAKILAMIVGSEALFWIIGMSGFGASYVNEVLGALLIIYIVVYRKHLTGTRIRSFAFPILCFFAGYTILSYVLDWFVSGYMFNFEVEKANLHISAFFLGLLLSFGSFITSSRIRSAARFLRSLIFEKKGERPKMKEMVSQMGHAIHVTIITKPLTKFLKYIPIPAFLGLYVCGHLFEISVFAENLGSQIFPGGNLNIFVTYAFGNLREVITGSAPTIRGGEKRQIDLKGRNKWGVLAQGHAIFRVELIDSAGNDVLPLYDKDGKPLQPQILIMHDKEGRSIPKGVTHVHTFYSLSRGELYTLIALLVNVVAFCINIYFNAIR